MPLQVINITRLTCDGGCGLTVDLPREAEREVAALPDGWVQLTMTLWRIGDRQVHLKDGRPGDPGYDVRSTTMVYAHDVECAQRALAELVNGHRPAGTGSIDDELARIDDQIDAGLGTGYIGELT